MSSIIAGVNSQPPPDGMQWHFGAENWINYTIIVNKNFIRILTI